jgi:hypothetical protein
MAPEAWRRSPRTATTGSLGPQLNTQATMARNLAFTLFRSAQTPFGFCKWIALLAAGRRRCDSQRASQAAIPRSLPVLRRCRRWIQLPIHRRDFLRRVRLLREISGAIYEYDLRSQQNPVIGFKSSPKRPITTSREFLEF